MKKAPSQNGPNRYQRIQDWAEEWIYQLNERGSFIFKLYDLSNEVFARIRFGGLRERASRLDVRFKTRTGLDARIRFLQPSDQSAFAEMLSGLKGRYGPPHAVDASGASAALARVSYLPFGIFVEEKLSGYLLLRLFYPSRAVTGIWTLPDTHNLGLGQEALKQTAAFSRAEDLPDYATIPIDNHNSLRMANAAGWQVIRTNHRFHVLLWQEMEATPQAASVLDS
jgi:hypothetical protein